MIGRERFVEPSDSAKEWAWSYGTNRWQRFVVVILVTLPGGATAQELSEVMGLSLRTTRKALAALVADGTVTTDGTHYGLVLP